MVSLLPCSCKAGDCSEGYTREEALKHIDDVVHLVVAALIEDGKLIPEDVPVSQQPLVSVTV